MLDECRVSTVGGELELTVVLPELRKSGLARELSRYATLEQGHWLARGRLPLTMADDDAVVFEGPDRDYLVELSRLWPDALLLTGIDGLGKTRFFELEWFRHPRPGEFSRDSQGRITGSDDVLFVEWLEVGAVTPAPRWVKIKGCRWWPCYQCMRFGDRQHMTFIDRDGESAGVEVWSRDTRDFEANLAALTKEPTTARFRAAVETTCQLFSPPVPSPWSRG